MLVTIAEHLLCMHICANAHNGQVLLRQREFAQECDVYIQGTLAVLSNHSSVLPQEYICRFRLITVTE